MGVNLISGEGNAYGNARGRRRRRAAVNEINMTPFIDVVLVLLIIFMVSAPMMSTGVPVDLPKVGAPAMNDPATPLEVRVIKGKILLQDTPVSLDNLVVKMQAIAGQKKDTPVHLRADRTLPYSDVMAVIGAVRQGGFTKLALVTDSPVSAAPAAGN